MKEWHGSQTYKYYMLRAAIIVVGLALFSGYAYCQSKNELVKKKDEAIREINLTNELLEKAQKERKVSLNALVLLNRKLKLRNNVINNIAGEISLINEQIKENNELVNVLQEDLNAIKEEYARMIYFAYKKRENYSKLIYVFAAKDLNQAYKRVKYLQQYTKFRREQAVLIQRMGELIESKIEKLKEYREERSRLLGQNEKEKENIASERSQRNRAVVILQREEQKLRQKLREKERIANELEKEIQAIIAEEARRVSDFSRLTPEEQLIADNFRNNKGRLPWPTERGVVTENFGIQEHPVLRGVKIENFGIDITTTENSLARAVFEGEVKKIIGIPGANQTIIIQHGSFFSVYQNLIEVRVGVGEMVNTKQPIGKVFTDKTEENKTVLNFMIWEEKTKMDPVPWLSEN